MAISETYSELIIEEILKSLLEQGIGPSAAEIASQFESFTAANDISKPLFIANNNLAVFGEPATATMWNGNNESILRDLKVLYRHMFKVSDRTLNNFHRWRSESKLLEGRLEDLQERITSLLLISSDTAGFFNFVQDNFVDNSKVDLTQSTAMVNVDKGTVSIGTSTTGATRHNLVALRDEDIEFTILSRNSLVSTVSATGSRTSYVISDSTNFWQEIVYLNKPGPVSAELKIILPEEVELSRIDVDLHMSNSNSTVQLTPMLSTDNFNFQQLPISNFTRSVLDKSTFQFAPTKTKYIKFIMTKAGFDIVNKGAYAYEFGVDEIALYNEAFETSAGKDLISEPLSVTDADGNPEEFSKVVLETCENVPDGTSISYFLAALNNEDDPVSSGVFVGIDPLNREDSTQPTILDFGDIDAITVPDVQISYNPLAATQGFRNPAQDFVLINSVVGSTVVTASGESSAVRYSFLNSNDRILNYSMKKDIQIAQGTLELWRNVNTIGQTKKVRGRQQGWGFEDPHFKTVVYVSNPAGIDIDFGGQPVIIDGASRTGKINLSQGRHSVLVHKDNWKTIDSSGVTDLASLKAADTLYPYNHRYLTEGYDYPIAYPTTEEQIYKGFDIVAEFFTQEISVFDLINNIAADDYGKFAIDADAADSTGKIDGVTTAKLPSSVFLLKVDENNPDFVNEDFLLKFKSANSLFKYLRLKAVLETTDPAITPFLDSYRIKISS